MSTLALDESALKKLISGHRDGVHDEDRLGCSSTSITDKNVKAVKRIIIENRRSTIIILTSKLKLNRTSGNSPKSQDLKMCANFG